MSDIVSSIRDSLKRIPRRWQVVIGTVAVVAIVSGLVFRGGDQAQYITAKVQRGSIRDAVEATGTVNAVRTVQVGSQVSGTIAKLHADFNSRVHQGDVIAEIEPALFNGAVLQAAADWESAKANIVAAEANLAKAKAALVQTKADYDRIVPLARDRIETQQALELARANYAAAVASVDGATANIVQARAQAGQKEAAVENARTNLRYTVIRSPINGIVVARNVDVGQTVAASLQAPTIFTIAQDLTKMQLYAKADESDIGRIKVGQPVTFKVDAFPKRVFHGTVSQLRMNATTVQNVVTYDAIIDFDNPEMKLFPGMTAYVTIPVATVQDVVKVPNVALRFKPQLTLDALQAIYRRYGIDDAQPVSGAAAGADDNVQRLATVGANSEPTPRGRRFDTVIVWKLHGDNSLEPVQVAIGITDHAYTELASVLHGDLKPGDELITASLAARPGAPGTPGVRR